VSNWCLKAFQVECQYEIQVKGNEPGPQLSGHTAQIYEDALYVYSGTKKGPSLWKYDLSKRYSFFDCWKFIVKESWALLNPACEGPGFSLEKFIWLMILGLRKHSSSFINENNMYIYGGTSSGQENPAKSDIFALNFSIIWNSLTFYKFLETLTWKRIQQQTAGGKRIDLHKGDLNGAVYQGYLVNFNQNPSYGSQISELSCWNIGINSFRYVLILHLDGNTWSTFDLQKGDFSSSRGNLIVYKNLLLVATSIERRFAIAILNLNSKKVFFKAFSQINRRWIVNWRITRTKTSQSIVYERRRIRHCVENSR